jgi:5-methylthioadenosine/S-adenosylhomocysteine deaminase
VDGDRIDYVGGTRPAAQYAGEKDLAGNLLMTGLYNLHTHTPMTLLRGLGSNLPLDRWLHEAMFPVEARLTPADVSVGTRLAMMEMLASGVVSFSDMYDRTQVTADEVIKAGMKANLNRPILGFDPAETYEANTRAQESLVFHDAYNGAGEGRILADFSIHAEYTSFEQLVRPYAADCLKRGARMHLHLSETVKEHEACKARYGKTPARWFLDLGVLDSPVIAAHCVAVEPADIEILARQGVSCVHNPSSNMKLGSGFMPLQTMLERGINVAIGTDGAASNNNLNLFEEIHLASLIHKGHSGDPTSITPEDLLLMATRNGARAQGRTDCGELAVGKKADLIAIDMQKPHLMPMHDVTALLVYSAQASDVAMTMVDGAILYEHGTYMNIDPDSVLHDLDESVARLFKTA